MGRARALRCLIEVGNPSRWTYLTTSRDREADEPLAPLAWFRLGGPAAYFARPRQLEELIALLKRCRQEGIAFKILGGGSNVLVRDEGVHALVIHLESPSFSDVTVRGNVVRGRGGRAADGPDLACRAGWSGGPRNLDGNSGHGGRCAARATPAAVKARSASSCAERRCSTWPTRSRCASETT